ncbi:HalOD1 output domain-containing protein [Haloarcula sp. JP-L23]|uniref:HalOD1 output domain-containing protein n=1 Tax=Haloarcula sp. JP-L23 TaxID=2716717 RepID=UPI00140EB829|nr:hypothetical protein G9465_19040 [Haloarcula sp. JP-L23]
MGEGAIEDVIVAIAQSKSVEPKQMDITLQNYISGDAIRRLVNHSASQWQLSFEIPEHNVVVTGNGGIFVDGKLENRLTKE